MKTKMQDICVTSNEAEGDSGANKSLRGENSISLEDCVEVSVGSLCNNHCIYCAHENKEELFPDKKTEEIKKLLRDFCDKSDAVVFSGGEPAIRDDIIEIVNYACERGYSEIHIQTNGRMFANKSFCREMVDAGANVFIITLSGHKEKLHNYITGADSFMQTVKGIINLKSLGQKVEINCVVTKPNYRHLPETARLFVKLGVNAFRFSFVYAEGIALKNYLSVVPRMSLAAHYIKEGLRIGLESGITALTEGVPFCLMDGYSDYAAEKMIPRTQIYDANCAAGNDTELRRNEGKTKRDACRDCIYDSACDGPWKEYTEFFGWDEFVPVQS